MSEPLNERAQQIDRALKFALGNRQEVMTARTMFDRAAQALRVEYITDDEIRDWSGLEPDDLIYQPRFER